MGKTRWLGRDLMCGPHLALCRSEADLAEALKYLKVTEGVPFHAAPGAHATTNTLYCAGKVVCLVCCDAVHDDVAALAALMAHEAVHVWQEHLESIGEKRPGHEVEAYAIQSITYELTAELLRRIEEERADEATG